ncbi:MAG: pantoate--beta-alanine ligase [Verrucomicrobiota bacterium]
MVTDLNFPLGIIVASTVREADGVAMSSRNNILVGNLAFWPQSIVLSRSIAMARKTVSASAKSRSVQS